MNNKKGLLLLFRRPTGLLPSPRLLPALLCLLWLAVAPCQAQDGNAPAPDKEKQEAPAGTGKRVDTNEFIGYEILLTRYLSLPYDAIMSINLNAFFVDIGFFLLIFLPFLFLFREDVHPMVQAGFVIILLLFLLVSVPSAFVNQEGIPIEKATERINEQLTDSDSATAPLQKVDGMIKKMIIAAAQPIHRLIGRISGNRDAVTYPLLIVLFLAVLLLAGQRLRDRDVLTRTMVNFLMLYSFLWLILSSGIIWYGLLMLPLGYLFVIRGMAGPKKQAHNLLRWPVIVLLAASLLWTSMAFSYRFANYQPEQDITARLPFLPAVSRFQIGQISEQAAFDRIFPAYDQALRAINSEEQSLIYRVGTYMPFFIRKNDRRLFTDNFLDFFENLSRKYPDKNTLAEVLKTNGFRYIIVDLNLVINDQTPEQVLRGRFEHFINTLYGNANLELIATDRQIRAPGSDQVFNAVFIPEGTITIPGTFAVYRIK